MVYTTKQGYHLVVHLEPSSATQRDFSALARYQDASSHALALQRHDTQSSNVIQRFFGTSDDAVILLKVDLLRNATYASTEQPLDTLHLWGSVAQDGVAVMMALPNLTYVYWNGERVQARPQMGIEWFYTLDVPGPAKAALQWTPPALSTLDWRARDALREASADFDDTHWTDANKTRSFNPYAHDPALDTQGTVLFASEYGFHANHIV